MYTSATDSTYYPFLQYVDAVRDTCKPLEKFGVYTVVHVRLNVKGERCILTNNPAWEKHFLENSYYLYPILGKFDYPSEIHTDKIFLLSDSLPKIPAIDTGMHKFDIGPTLVYIEKFDSYVEYVFFSARASDTSINNIYLNNKELFSHFIGFFRSSLAKELQESSENKLHLPLADKNHIYSSFDIYDTQVREKVAIFKREIILKDVPTADSKEIAFSNREHQCILHMENGLTAKEIAKTLSISPRTVEHYIDNIKDKLGVKNKLKAMKLLKDIGAI